MKTKQQILEDRLRPIIKKLIKEESEPVKKLIDLWVSMVQTHNSPGKKADLVGKKLYDLGLLDLNDDYDASDPLDIKYHFWDGSRAKGENKKYAKYLQGEIT